MISQATILNPRFKKFGFMDENKYRNAVKLLYHRISNIKPVHVNNNNHENIPTSNEKPVYTDNRMNKLWEKFDSEVKSRSRQILGRIFPVKNK